MKNIILFLVLIICSFFVYKTYEYFDCYAPEFNEKLWEHDIIIEYNNCYSYAMNFPMLNRKYKASPGGGEEDIGNKGTNNANRNYDIYTCSYFDKLIKNDYPNIIKKDVNNVNELNCPTGYYQMALVIDDEKTPYEHDGDDFHFYRKDCDTKYWSHKPGGSHVSRVDASGNLITDPKYCDRNYGDNNYYKFCSYYCVPFDDTQYNKIKNKLNL